MANLFDDWDEAHRAPEPVEVARRSAGELAVDAVTGREEFRESARRIEEGQTLSGLGLGAFTAATFVFPWGRGGRLAMAGARGLGGGRAAALRAARGLGDADIDGLSLGATGRPTVGQLSDEASDVLRGAGVEPAEASVLADSVFQLRGQVADTGGFTWDPRSGRVSFDKGYATTVVKGYERPIPLSRFGASDAVDYLKFVPEGQSDTVAQKLAANPRNMVGAWVEPIDGVDHVFMDVSSVIRDRDTALRIGGALNEMGVYGFAERQTLYLRDFPEYLPGGSKFTPDALNRYGFSEGSSVIPVGRWTENPTAEEIPLSFVRPFREFDRSTRQVGTDIQDLARQIRERGFDEPIVLDVDPQGWAMVSDGNHRLAAAELLGLETVPVRVATRRSGKLVGGPGARLDVADGLGEGKLMKPSQVFLSTDKPELLRVGRDLPESGRSDLLVPPSLVAGEGGFAADIPGTRVRELAEELAQRHLDSPTGLAALEPREIAATLEALPEFSEFVRLYREMVVGGMRPGTLDRRRMRPGSLIEFAGLAELGTPRWSKGLDTSLSFPASLQGSLPQAVRDGAINLGTRIRNMSVFVNDDIYDPTFYVEFNRIINSVSAETGMPAEVLSTALASASSQAAPYDEVLRFARVAPMVRVTGGVADVVPGSAELLGTDTMAITALNGLVDAVNRPDFLTFKPAGQAMKTAAYAYNRLDPLYVPVYVSDTVDALGQFMVKGLEPGMSKAQHSIVNQIAGRTLANLYDVNPSAVQEATWSHIRVARDGIQLTSTGKPTATAIAPAFTGSQGTVEEVLTAAVNRMDDNVVRLARQNRDKFYADAKAGELRAWEWDALNNRPVVSSSEYLIPADQRPTVRGRAGILQSQMLQLVESLGPNLRAQLLALSAAAGIGLPLLIESLGGASLDIPDEVVFEGFAGA